MATNPQVNARVDPDTLARLDALLGAANAQREPGTRKMDRGAIVRVCILRALPALEQSYGIARMTRQKGPKRPGKKK